jgi:hypothetical protein
MARLHCEKKKEEEEIRLMKEKNNCSLASSLGELRAYSYFLLEIPGLKLLKVFDRLP